MSIFNRATTEPIVDDDTPAELPVPEALQPYWDRTTGLTEAERAHIITNGGIRVYDTTYRVIGPRDEPRRHELLTLDEYDHQLRLEQAEQLRRGDELAAYLPPLVPCQLCGDQVVEGGLIPVAVSDGRTAHVHPGACLDLVRGEVLRRQHADALAALLG